MKAIKLCIFVALLFIGSFALGCGDDDNSTDSGGSDPNVFCNEELCVNNSELKNKCIDAFNTCIAENPDVNEDECVATALLICNAD